MRRGACTAALKRLGALEAPRTQNQGRGVLEVPAMRTIDEWEAHAVPYQAALIASMCADMDAPRLNERKKV